MRLRVPGGWIYHIPYTTVTGLCFVPDPDHTPTLKPVPYDAGWSGIPGDPTSQDPEDP